MSGWLIAGLGNPGREYQKTRHNVGFMLADALARHWELSFNRRRSHAEIAEGTVRGERILLVKPQTYMNQSGDSIRALLKMANLDPERLLVVYDEMDLPFGRLRLRDQGSSGGHRGMGSVVDQLRTNAICRLRIGVGRPPPGLDPIDYVLLSFTSDELARLPDIFDRAIAGIEVLVAEGVTSAMNVVNLDPRPRATTEDSESHREPPPALR